MLQPSPLTGPPPPVESPRPDFPYPQVELIGSDGEPLDTPWHRAQINLFIGVLVWLWRGRTDYFVGGNMFVYYSVEQARNRDYRGPDFFYVGGGVDRRRPRQWWATWEENGRYPDFIVELLSPSTAREDRTTKKDIYERTFRTPEYFLYDPDAQRWQGWRLNAQQQYEAVSPDERGWMWSEQLQLWIGPWQGEFEGMQAVWLRFYHPDGRLALLEAEAATLEAEAARQQAEAARQQAEAARQQAEAARQQAEAAERRAEASEAEVARLRARLAQLEGKSDSV